MDEGEKRRTRGRIAIERGKSRMWIAVVAVAAADANANAGVDAVADNDVVEDDAEVDQIHLRTPIELRCRMNTFRVLHLRRLRSRGLTKRHWGKMGTKVRPAWTCQA